MMKKLLLCWLICQPLTGLALQPGDVMPDFRATTLDGEAIQAGQWRRGHPLYLKFWATWCVYCQVEMPHLQGVYQRYGEQIRVLTVNVGINDSVANIRRLFAEKGLSLPTVFDEQGELTSLFQVVGTPQHILIGADGRVRYRSFLADDELDRILAGWAAETANNRITVH